MRCIGQGLIKNPPKTNTSIPDKENWQSLLQRHALLHRRRCEHRRHQVGGGVQEERSRSPGIPYGIDISILSDPETVLPFCILDGTLVTAMRTSAVGGLLAKYAAPSNAETACLVGAGVIGRTMVMRRCARLSPRSKTMYLCDHGCTPRRRPWPQELRPTASAIEDHPDRATARARR